MKKTVVIFVLLLCTAATSIFLYKKSEQKSQPAHTVTLHGRPYQPLDTLRKYFGHIGWGGKMSVRDFVQQKFGEQVLSNLHRIRFDAPDTPEFEIEPELQYFHPKGGGKYGIKSFYTSFHPHIVAKEVLPESKMYFTFGNKRKLSEELKQNYIEILKANLVHNPENVMKITSDYHVTAIVTHIQPDMCPEAEIHDVSLLPWPQKPNSVEAVTFDQMEMCYKHPDGWFYFITTQFNANHKDVQNYNNLIEK